MLSLRDVPTTKRLRNLLAARAQAQPLDLEEARQPDLAARCPHCDRLLSEAPQLHVSPVFDDWKYEVAGVHLTPSQWKILTALRQRFGRGVSLETLKRAVASPAADARSDKLVEVHLCRIRKALKSTPYVIVSSWGRSEWALKYKDAGERKEP